MSQRATELTLPLKTHDLGELFRVTLNLPDHKIQDLPLVHTLQALPNLWAYRATILGGSLRRLYTDAYESPFYYDCDIFFPSEDWRLSFKNHITRFTGGWEYSGKSSYAETFRHKRNANVIAVQLVNCVYGNIAELLTRTDFTCNQICYDGQCVYHGALFPWDIRTRTLTVVRPHLNKGFFDFRVHKLGVEKFTITEQQKQIAYDYIAQYEQRVDP